jgi:hypothetical protein
MSTNSPEQPVKLFISYAHEDDTLRSEFTKHLAALRNQKLIDAWYDGRIAPGEMWEKAIFDQLDTADIILLLISADVLNSYFCYERELSRALQCHAAGQARVAPIILRPCLWEGDRQFGHLQVLPYEGQPITGWNNRDEAFTNVVRGLKQVVQELADTNRRVARAGGHGLGTLPPEPPNLYAVPKYLGDSHFIGRNAELAGRRLVRRGYRSLLMYKWSLSRLPHWKVL